MSEAFTAMTREPGMQEAVALALQDRRLQRILAFNGTSEAVVTSLVREPTMRSPGDPRETRALIREIEAGERPPGAVPDSLMTEAIVRVVRRPVYLISRGAVDPSSALAPFQEDISRLIAGLDGLIAAVGRVDFINHQMAWGGTGWLIEEDLVVTNRHVAELVGEPDGRGGYRFAMAGPNVSYGARLDFLEEHGAGRGAAEHLAAVSSIEYIAPSDGPDVALLRLSRSIGPPIPLNEAAPREGQLVGVVGYPADDPRNDAAAVTRYFGTIFDKKRFAPGYIMQEEGVGGPHFTHDCTTLGGNSGSVVFDLATRKAVGLHFAGSFGKANFAVPAALVARVRTGLRVVVGGFSVPEEAPDGRHEPGHFAGRPGYDALHLGSDAAVELPGFDRHAAEVAEVAGAADKVVRYRHFSVVQQAARRMPLFAAVNIDGGAAVRLKRGNDRWFADLRLDPAVQLDQGHYSHPDIDRGHMVRREDPNWGSDAQQANDDTFHYVNAAPQHASLNRGKKAWLGLESYILDSARTHGFRLSVFTGPVLRDTDRTFATRSGDLQVPEEFWKVVVAKDAQTGGMRATGYILGQARLLDDLEGVAFTYGEYGTFQVAVSSIEKVTGLDFHGLAAADPFGRTEAPGRPLRRLLRHAEEAVI